MTKLFLTVLILIFSLQCKIFKPSDLDPSQDIGSLQTLLRYLALADAFNTYSQTVAFMKFTDSNGTPYSTGTVEYSVFNEADENGIPTTPYGENIQPLTVTLDTAGRGFLFFSERGIATLTVKNSGNVVGTARFRIYNGITKQTFSILSQTGATQFVLEDLANYRNRMATNTTFTPLGSINGRQFIYLEVQTTNTGINQYKSSGYIASSADGENYDQITKIDGVTIERNVSYEYALEISKPTFNGSEYVFFISEERRDYPTITNFQSNKNFGLRISAITPFTSNVINLSLNSSLYLFREDNVPWNYPNLYIENNRYVITPSFYGGGVRNPQLLNSDFTVNQDLVSGFSCAVADGNNMAVGYQSLSFGGTDYLQCPTSSTLINQQTFDVRSIDSSGLSNRLLTFNATPLSFHSPPVFVRGKFVALFGTGPSVGYTFNADTYGNTTPSLNRNSTAISGFSSSITPGSGTLLRSVKSSGNSDYFILSSNPTFTTPTINIFRSIDGLASANLLPAIPLTYSTGITSPEQLQSANGKLNYSYAISAGTGIDSRPVYLTHFTNDDGTWESLPRLIKIR